MGMRRRVDDDRRRLPRLHAERERVLVKLVRVRARVALWHAVHGLERREVARLRAGGADVDVAADVIRLLLERVVRLQRDGVERRQLELKGVEVCRD